MEDNNSEINIEFDVLDVYWSKRYEEEYGHLF